MSTSDYEIKSNSVEQDQLTLEVEVQGPVVNRAFKKVYKRLLRLVHIPGFRSGKAPMDVLARRVGQEQFISQVEAELLPRYYYEAVESQERRPTGEVNYSDKSLEKGKPFRFTATVEVSPLVELGDYNNLDIDTVEIEEITDERIDEELNRLRRRLAQLKPVEDEAAIDDDCLVNFDCEGKFEGRVYKTLSSRTTLLIGDDDFLPGFGDNLKGLKKGEKKEFVFQMPDDYDPKHLAGKNVNFSVEVHSFQKAVLPELGDDFAKDVGAYENLDQLKAKIRSELTIQRDRRREDKFSGLLREKLAEIVKCDIPAERIDRRVAERLKDFRERFHGTSVSFEEHLAENGKSEEEFRNEIKEREQREMLTEFGLDEIALKEGLEVSDKDVERRIYLTAQVLRRDPEEIADILDSTGSRILKKYDLLREKAFSMLQERYRMKAGFEVKDENLDK